MITSFCLTLIKMLLTWIYILAILFGEFDRKKWWCYLVMIASIVFIWI